jgi:SAM-dependent methyltransferase
MTSSEAAYEPASWEEVACPFCGSRDRRLYERFGWKLRFTYVRCRGCGLVYQSPRPGYEQLVRTYDDYFSFGQYASATEAQKRSWVAGQEAVVTEILAFDSERTRILDVGSNMGSFLRAARPHYAQVAGVEISRKMRDFVAADLGVPVFDDFVRIPDAERFSCIHMSHVIEHVPDPVRWLEKARSLLGPRGLLVIAVPNMLSADRRLKLLMKNLRLRRGEWSEPNRTPDHLFEPTIPATLRFLEAHGFDVESHYTYSRSDETSLRPLNRLYRRWLLLGSNTRLYARVRAAR